MNYSKNHRTKAGAETCGMGEPKLDLFSDVKRALHAHLMRTDRNYSKASRDAVDRNRRRVEAGQ